ncbi:MAG: SPOR domain-containing protein [Acidobacteria bacterium]|nr:SPOR domain-containing protein [Acidobacteriota bacterium]
MFKSTHLAINSLLVLFLFTGFAAAQANQYTVQLVAFPALETAQDRVRELKAQGLDAYIIRSEVAGKGTFFRVRVGKFPNQNEARKYGASLQTRGVVPQYFIASYEPPQEDFTITRGANLAGAQPTNPLTQPTNPPFRAEPQPTTPVTVENASKGTPAASGNPSGPGVNSFVPAGTGANLTSSPAAPIPTSVSFLRFQDLSVGYSFERPQYWEGGALDPKDAQDQKSNAGSLFKSYQDSAFINAIWNSLDKANSEVNDNDLIVEVILRSMEASDGTQQMTETSRRVVSEGAFIKTYLDLKATFKNQGQEAPLDFLAKAVIVRANKGILLVVTFFSKNGPPYVPSIADRIIASVKAPD